ncbi:MAG: hypothetical protein Q9M50_05055 [Methylococcales bacterium]|nr:hypothetical protein [Methylococcales bacterium]
MNYLYLLPLFLLSACVQQPKIIAGKGAVYGVLSADAHPAFKNKIQNATNDTASAYGDSTYNEINYKNNMVNYPSLKALYVGLVTPDHSPQSHHLSVNPQGISPYSLALSPDDTLHIHNKTPNTQHFFITATLGKEGFQSFPALKAGEKAGFTVKLEGNLDLLSSDNDKLKVHLFPKKNMQSKPLSSGQSYQFELLNPGDYQLIFWYWRLGKIQQHIHINAEENRQVNQVLTVKSVMQAD